MDAPTARMCSRGNDFHQVGLGRLELPTSRLSDMSRALVGDDTGFVTAFLPITHLPSPPTPRSEGRRVWRRFPRYSKQTERYIDIS